MARGWFIGTMALVLGGIAAIAWASPAHADNGRVYYSTSSHDSVAVNRHVTNAKDRRARIVGVHHGTAKVVVNHQAHYVNLDRDYIRQGHGQIDTNHWLPASQRLARRLANPGVYVVVNERARQDAPANGQQVIKPLFIIENPKAKPLPKTPKRRTSPGLVARAN